MNRKYIVIETPEETIYYFGRQDAIASYFY